MTAIRLVHAADLHLDTPFEGISRPAPDVARALRDASLAAWDNLVDFALAQNVHAMLLAGDIYDGAERGLRAQLRVLAGLSRLSEAGVSTFIVHGNHDPLDGWAAIREWPARVHVFAANSVESVPLLIEGQAAATVHGISHSRRHVTENLASGFHRTAAAGAHIGLLHATVGSSGDHEVTAPCSLAHLEAAGLDYWALGHIHARAVLRASHPCVVYAGNIQGRSPKPSELGAKGAYFVELDSQGDVLGLEFHALDRVRFVELRLDVGQCRDLPALHGALLDGLEKLRDEHAGRGLVVRVVLEGRGTVVTDLRHADALEQLRDDLRAHFAAHAPFVWVENVLDRAASVLDMQALRDRSDFPAAVLALSERLRDNPQELLAFVTECGAQLTRGQVGRVLRDIPDEDVDSILSEAVALAIDRLTLNGES